MCTNLDAYIRLCEHVDVLVPTGYGLIFSFPNKTVHLSFEVLSHVLNHPLSWLIVVMILPGINRASKPGLVPR